MAIAQITQRRAPMPRNPFQEFGPRMKAVLLRGRAKCLRGLLGLICTLITKRKKEVWKEKNSANYPRNPRSSTQGRLKIFTSTHISI